MLHTAKNSPNKRLVDQFGTLVPNVVSFDDELFEATLLFFHPESTLPVRFQNEKGEVEVLQTSITIPGAKLIDIGVMGGPNEKIEK